MALLQMWRNNARMRHWGLLLTVLVVLVSTAAASRGRQPISAKQFFQALSGKTNNDYEVRYCLFCGL